MRHVPTAGESPPPEWLARAAQATAALEAEHDPKARMQLIKRREGLWRELKDWLLSLSLEKCWFSEAKDCFQHWDVEHYRPKAVAKDLSGNDREGYWWLSFEWSNFRVCGRVGNAKKSTSFPLGGSYCATSKQRDIADEQPYLLDPTIKADCILLSFNSLGDAVADPDADAWSKERVRVSVDQYALNFEKLVLQRKTIWETCRALIGEVQNLMKEQAQHPSASRRAHIEGKIEQLTALVDRKSVCSSAAIACLLKSQVGWAMRLGAAAA